MCLGPGVGYHVAAALDPEGLDADLTSALLATTSARDRALAQLAVTMSHTGEARLPTEVELTEAITTQGPGPMSADEIGEMVNEALGMLSEYSNASRFRETEPGWSVYGTSGDIVYALGPERADLLPETARDHLHRSNMGSDIRHQLWERSRYVSNHADLLAVLVRHHIRRKFLDTAEGARLFSHHDLTDFSLAVDTRLRDPAVTKKALWDLELTDGLDHDTAAELIDRLRDIRRIAGQGIVHAAGNHLLTEIAHFLARREAVDDGWERPSVAAKPSLLAPAAALVIVLRAADGRHVPAMNQVTEAFRELVGRHPRPSERALLKDARTYLADLTGWPSPDGSSNERQVVSILRDRVPDVEISDLQPRVPNTRRRFDIAVKVPSPGGPITVPIEVDGAQHSHRCDRFHPTAADFQAAQHADVLKQAAWAAARTDHDSGLVVIDHTALSSTSRRDTLTRLLPELLAAAADCDIVVAAARQATGRALCRSWHYEAWELDDELHLLRGWSPRRAA